MTDLATSAPSQPAPPAQTSDATSDNRSGAQFKRQLLTSFIERQAAADAPTTPPAVETATPETPAPLTETPTATPEQPAPLPEATPEATPPAPVPPEEPTPDALDDGDDTAANDVLSQLSSLDSKTQKLVREWMDQWTKRRHEKIQKRIDKERAKRGDLDRELAELKNRPPEIQRVAVPSEASPLADINDVQALTQRHAEAKEAKRWAKVTLDNEQWERVKVGDKEVEVVREGDRYFTKTDVKGILRNAESHLEEHIPQRLNFLQRREQVRNAARQDFPFLSDKNSPEYQQVQAAYQARPWLMNDPEAELIISAAVEGLKVAAERRKAAAATAPTAPKPAAPKPPASQTAVPATAAAGRVSGEQHARRNAQQERERLGEKGNVTSADLRRYFKNSANR